MKRKSIMATVMGVLLIGMAQGAFSQSPEEAYWVIEGSLHDPTYTLIHYYDQNGQLIKDERMEGKYLDIKKRNT